MRIRRLNKDNSWIFEFNRLKILVDPWLHGSEIDYFPWFNEQIHRTAPVNYEDLPSFDVVLISQKYPDHFHTETLKKLNPTQFIVPHSLESKIKKLYPKAVVIGMGKKKKHFSVNNVDFNWFVSSRFIDPIYEAIHISDKESSLFFAPHGYDFSKSKADVPQKTDVLICPFNLYQLPGFLGGTVAPGSAGLKHLNEVCNPRFIFPSHDEDKIAKGIVPTLAKVKWNSKKDFENYPEIFNKINEADHYDWIEI